MSDSVGSVSSISELLEDKGGISHSLDLGNTQCSQCINSSSNVDELRDKLDILENVAKASSNSGLLIKIQDIKNKIDEGASVASLKEMSGIR